MTYLCASPLEHVPIPPQPLAVLASPLALAEHEYFAHRIFLFLILREVRDISTGLGLLVVMFASQIVKSLPNLSLDVSDASDWQHGPLRRLEHHLDITALATEPASGLFAIGRYRAILVTSMLIVVVKAPRAAWSTSMGPLLYNVP